MFARVTLSHKGHRKMRQRSSGTSKNNSSQPSGGSPAFRVATGWLTGQAAQGWSITLWESAEAEQASQMMAAQARAKAVTALGGEVKSVQVYEVVAHAQPEERRVAAKKKTRRLVRPKKRRAA